MYPYASIILLHLLFLAIPTLAGHAQFFDKSSNVGFTLSTVHNETSTDLVFQISAPLKYGWGAVGTGDRMDGSLMFIIYPSGQSNDVTVSIRTSRGHDTPAPISSIDYTVQSSAIHNSFMTADVICRNCTQWSSGDFVHINSSKQPWIYAAGPGQSVSSSLQDANIEKHSTYGTFFIDMNATRTTSTSIPSLSGTTNISTTALPGSVAALVILHAICLGGSFVILFPIGVSLLRFFGSVRFHWVVQVVATFTCIIGLVVAITLSIMDVEYNSFTAVHQIIGIVIVAVLIVQVILGYVHHMKFKKHGGITWFTCAHLWTGRTVIIFGMLNTVLGFLLARSTGGAVFVAVIAIVVLVGTYTINYLGKKRKQAKEVASWSLQSSDTALLNFSHPDVR